jgi:ATP-dependent helicase/DNAse subunit B
MSIKVFYTPFRYRGSTETLLGASVEKITGPDYSKILYIAPTPRKVRDAQRRFYRFTEDCYIPPEMMTIKQLSKMLYHIYGDRKIISQPPIPVIISHLSGKGIGFSSIITDFISEIKQYHPGKDIETIRKELGTIFHELGIPEEVSVRAMEAIKIFKAYQELLNKHSLVDENDVMAICPLLIKRHHYSPPILLLDGFYELTSSEEAILKTLIEHANDTIISIPYDINYSEITKSYITFLNNNFKIEESYVSADDQTPEPFYHPYPGIEEEVGGITRCIKNYFISGKVRDLEETIITFPKLYEYSDMVERIFRKYGIPYTLSTSKPAGKSRPFLDLLALLESVEEDYPRLPFTQFLTSPYLKNMPPSFREAVPMLSLRSGIVKGKDAWLNLTQAVSGEKIAVSNEIERGLRWVFKKLSPLESIKNSGTFSHYGEVIGKLLNDFGFSHEDADLKEKTSYILKELSFIDHLAPTPHTLRQFIDSLRHILNTTETEIEGTGLQVMGFLELRGLEPEYLFFGGLKDGDLPSKPDIDHLLPDSVRTKFGLVNLKRYLLLQRFVFSRAIALPKNLHLSYPVMEGDKFFLPSPFLPWNRGAEERVYGIFSKEEELLRRGKTPLALNITEIERMGEKLITDKYGEKSFIRVTDIDYYRTCPRKFFIEKVLLLEPPEAKEYRVEAVLLGIIAHEIMQHLLSKPFVDAEELRVIAEATIEKLLSEKPLEHYWKNLIRDSFLSILPEIYELESKLRNEGYSLMEAEFPVKGEITKGIKLRGKIDRVDRKDGNGVELIDYKTGIIQFTGSEVMTKGAQLQLFIYAALMRLLGFKVERAGIYSLKDVRLLWIPGKKDVEKGLLIDDYIDVSLKFLGEAVAKMRSGNFSASPLYDHTCWNCTERPYCPYIQKTVMS